MSHPEEGKIVGIIQYEVVDVSPLQFKDKVMEALGNPEDKPLTITAIVILDELAKRRGEVARSDIFRLRVQLLNTDPLYVNVSDQYGRWLTIDIPSDNAATVSFEVITNE